MQTLIPRWLRPPVFPDEEKTRIAGLLNLLLLALIVIIAIDAILLLIFAPETLPTIWMNGLSIALGVSCSGSCGEVRCVSPALCFV